jgi:hypothetical protein
MSFWFNDFWPSYGPWTEIWPNIAKNYIYKCKLKEKIPNIIELKYRIKNYYSLEQYIAIKKQQLKRF